MKCRFESRKVDLARAQGEKDIILNATLMQWDKGYALLRKVR